MEITGKVALVTGGSSGIGRATALALAREGARVAIADVDVAGGEETVRQIQAAGGEAFFVESDVSTPAGIQAMFDTVRDAYGAVDIVHNNAGIMTADTPGWPDVGLERIHLVMSTNASGVMMGTRQAIADMRGRGGVVVNTASIAGQGPLPNDPIYSASKAAIIRFTESCEPLAKSHGVRINAVLPGIVDTPIVLKTGDGTKPAAWLEPALAAAQLLKPEVIAEAVLDFVRDDAQAGVCRVVTEPPSGEE